MRTKPNRVPIVIYITTLDLHTTCIYSTLILIKRSRAAEDVVGEACGGIPDFRVLLADEAEFKQLRF